MRQTARTRLLTALAVMLLTLLGCGLAASTWHVYGHTWDEPEHLAAGMSLLDTGRYDYDIQHPPIARLMLAVGPYLAGARSQGKPPPDGKPEGIAILYGSGHYDQFLTLARAGALPFLALLIVMTYLWGRAVLPPGGALLATLLAATTPVLIGHGALATLDVPSAATCLLAMYAIQRWLHSGRLMDALGLGLALGLAIGVKLSAIPFVGIGGLVLLGLHAWSAPARGAAREPVRRLQWAAGVVAATLVMFAVLTAAYGGRFVYLTDHAHKFNQALGYLFGYVSGPLHDPAYRFFADVPVPAAFQWIVGGIQALVVHNNGGHLSYLFGEMKSDGWRYFYVVAMGVKTQLPLLLLGLVGLWRLGCRGFSERAAVPLALPLIFVALFAFASFFSHINIGVRHLLVLYPLLAIGAAALLVEVYGWLRSTPGGARRVLVIAALTLAGSAEAWAVVAPWPDYLPYFNLLAPHPERVLVDSDLDWGQDFRRLTLRLRALKVPSVSLAYLGTADLKREDLPPYVLLGPDQRATGWIAVSQLARIHAPQRFRWLDAYTPRERVGASIELYYVAPLGPAG